MKVLRGYSRRFLIAASAYRKMARDRDGVSFSPEMLDEQYRYESTGAGNPDPRVNGYTCGKWVLDATLKQMRQDHYEGLMTKHELCSGSCFFVRREIQSWLPTRHFQFR